MSGADLEWLRSKLTPQPLKTWETPLHFASPFASSIPRTFIHCTEGLSAEDIAAEEQQCTDRGWKYRSIAAGHDAMITAPDELTRCLLELA